MLFLHHFFKENSKTKLIVFVLLFTLSIAGFYRIGNSRIEELEQLMENVLHSFLTTSADGISVGYFQWDEMYEAVLSNDTGFIEDNIISILSTFPSVSQLEIVDAPFDGLSSYSVRIQTDNLYFYFGIFDSNSIDYIPDKMIRATFDPDEILGHALENVNMDFQIIIPSTDRHTIESVKIQFDKHPLEFYHFISATLIGFLGLLFLHTYRRYTISKHYEVEGLANIIMLLSKKDAYTAEHSKDVAHYAKAIACSLGMTRAKQKVLEKAGYLHDIGKIGISESILNKPGKLTAEEFERIQEHSTIGFEIVSQFPNLSEVAIIVKGHHELLDGSGYPDGLKGNAIPLTAQILSVADVYSALTTIRPYRKNFSSSEAFTMMQGMSLNQELVAILNRYILKTNSDQS